MKLDTVGSLREAGFWGFRSADDLTRSGLAEVPDVSGVYMVARDPTLPPVFAPMSVGGHFKQKDPTVDRVTLQRN